MRRRIARRSRAHSKALLAKEPMRMARKCSVKNCEMDDVSVRTIGLSTHKFPRESTLKYKWLINCGFDTTYRLKPGQFICHRHFCRSDYELAKPTGNKYILKKGTVPTIFDNYDNHPDPMIPIGKISNVSYPQEDLDLINNSSIGNFDNVDSSTCSSDMTRVLPESDDNLADLIINTKQSDDLESNDAPKLPNDVKDDEKNGDRGHVNGDNDDLKNGVDSSVVDENVKKKMKFSEDPPAEPPPLVTTKPESDNDKAANVIDTKRENVNMANSNRVKQSTRNEKATRDEQRTRVNRSGLKFFAGARLEAKDFNEKWYAARVVETDWVDREVLIHFDKWSSRFDEWIPMDSSRLRVLQMQPSEQTWVIPVQEPKMRGFSVGERILATWADGRKYPAKVNAVLGNDKYDVLFDDGYAKVVRSSKMTKVACTSTKVVDKVASPEPYIGSKQERRDKNRKHTVMELFQHKRRSKSDGGGGSGVVKKEDACVDRATTHVNGENNHDGVADGYYDSGSELLHGFEMTKPKVKNHAKRKREMPTKHIDTDHEDDGAPEWIDGEPQGIESFVVDGNDGSRRSIIVHDRKLPPGWQKHFIQRRTGSSAGKWDVLFLHKPTGKKFRSRNDIRVFFESQGQAEFDPDMFDFCIHRRKRSAAARSKSDTSQETQKKIKTLLPKTKAPIPAATDNLLLTPSTPANTSVPIMPSTTPVDDSAVFIGGLRVEMEDSAYKCPKEGCCKTFRKENLLQMHIKHYHPEFSKYLGSTPNVADLAYARTIGESILDMTPKKTMNLNERGAKFEKKKAGGQFVYSSGQSALSSASSLSVSMPNANGDVQTSGDIYHHNGNGMRDDMKYEMMSPGSSASFDVDEDIGKKSDGNCAMSPGTLFDMKIREEKTQVGIKTLLPVRSVSATTNDTHKNDRYKSIVDEHMNIEKGKRKRQLSEYSSDASTKSKRRHGGLQEITDDYADLDDSALDAEGPAALVYRFSRRKSDTKSDENSQSSQLNDSRVAKSDSTMTHNNKDPQDGGEGVMMMINGELVKVEQLRREEIINCTCGFMEEDGLMIQCDLCLCWQHGHCNAIERERDVPEKYICYICRHPFRQRPSKMYLHDQDWIKEGKLPSLSKRTKDQAVINQRTAMLKRSYDLVSVLVQVQQILHSLRVKINVAQRKDHPKLYLWAKNWEKSDIPKPNIEPVSIMEEVKTEPEPIENENENSQPIDPMKLETKPAMKDEVDVKSIPSDTELMKILEEDSVTMSDDTKATKKGEVTANKNGQILLDALTHSDVNGDVKCNDDEKTTEVKLEKTDEQQNTATIKDENEKIEKEGENVPIKNETLETKTFQPLQPFIPEPEAPIDPAECRLRLLEHIEHFQNHIDARLTTVEAQLAVLEVIDDDDDIGGAPTAEVQPRVKETIQMLLRDLSTVRKLAALC